MENGGVKASSIIRQLEDQGVTHVVTLPDSETNGMYTAIEQSPRLSMVPVCREGIVDLQVLHLIVYQLIDQMKLILIPLGLLVC